MMKQFVKDCLTSKDGESYDIGRFLWVLGVFAFIGLSIYALSRGGAFDPLNWGAGYGAILGGGGAGIGMKSKTEPDA
ncbi:MAG: amino acid ABC transporter substrate-binding protein [Planctomycetes bacterium]|nr:amino acid ABC transporter substrate-binding protein [Planctomycetota bacterium]